MSVIEPVNTQQVLQMSAAVEKVFTQQQMHHAVGNALNEERIAQDEKKRTEVQDPEGAQETDSTDPDGLSPKQRLRIMKAKDTSDKEETEADVKVPVTLNLGRRVDIRV